jgi:hypothetical protein
MTALSILDLDAVRAAPVSREPYPRRSSRRIAAAAGQPLAARLYS